LETSRRLIAWQFGILKGKEEKKVSLRKKESLEYLSLSQGGEKVILFLGGRGRQSLGIGSNAENPRRGGGFRGSRGINEPFTF